MKWLERIAITLLILGACGIPGAVEFGDWLGPVVLLAVGTALKLLTNQFCYED